MKVLVAGGGTGGHVYPALAIMEGLRRHPTLSVQEIAYVGTKRGLENRIIPEHHWIKFFKIRTRGFDRKNLLRCLLASFELPIGLIQTLFILLKFKPQVIIGVGGYAAFPPLLWGIFLRIPTVIHEQNIKPGLVNRSLARWVTRVCVTYPETARYLKRAKSIRVTGLPVRPSLFETRPNYSRFGLEQDRATLFVVGGSRGSEFLTRTVLDAYPKLNGTQVLLITGPQSYPAGEPSHRGSGRGRLVQIPYVEDMGAALAVADLVICRAGATTLAELAAVGKPAILVPWPGAAENHQYENARALAESGGCLLAPESELNADKLAELVSQLLNSQTKLNEMKSRMSSVGRKAALDHILREVELLVHA